MTRAGQQPIGEGDFPRCPTHKKPLTLHGSWYTDLDVTRLSQPYWTCPKGHEVRDVVLPPKNEVRR